MSTRRLQQGLVIALVLAAAALLLDNMLGTPSTTAGPAVHAQAIRYTVLRASKVIAKGAAIVADDVETAELTGTPPSAGAFARRTELTGRIAARRIKAHEILSQTNTSRAPRLTTLADEVPQGLRAISLHVNDDFGVADLLRPGDHVDVLVVSNAKRGLLRPGRLFPSAEVKTLLQDVLVLAVGQSIDPAAPPGRSTRDITLAVSPQDAQVVALIRTIGHEYLALRRKGDETTSLETPVTTAGLALQTASTRRDAASGPRPARAGIEIIRGPAPVAALSSFRGSP